MCSQSLFDGSMIHLNTGSLDPNPGLGCVRFAHICDVFCRTRIGFVIALVARSGEVKASSSTDRGTTLRTPSQSLGLSKCARCARSVDEVGLGEQIGSLFVEYLRAHVQQDTHHRLGRVWQRIGAGATVEASIAAEYGRSLADHHADFVAHVEATEGDPTRRLAGTVFEGVTIRTPTTQEEHDEEEGLSTP